jgi:hypothetical protein
VPFFPYSGAESGPFNWWALSVFRERGSVPAIADYRNASRPQTLEHGGAQMAHQPKWDPDVKRGEDAIAADKRANAHVVKVCPSVTSRSIVDCSKVCALFNATKRDAKERVARGRLVRRYLVLYRQAKLIWPCRSWSGRRELASFRVASSAE